MYVTVAASGEGVMGRKPIDASLANATFASTSSDASVRCSIVVSISACHAEDPGSIPGGGVALQETTRGAEAEGRYGEGG